MAKLDEAKERLGLLKFWLGVFVACFVSICAWCATNYKLFNEAYVLFCLAVLLDIVLLVIIYKLNKESKNILKEIKNLKSRE
ncbi:MAG: hypothetical protein MSH30_03845 [Campylobacter sp.]|uniref:hypothetical protein n=1 Tax=Campylobacter sp. TaxID=205 RepID=UPI002AA7EEA5|nr:hypothetical protein [Campylobacter sp.]MDD6161761.1 hypothetical protein [Campylobacteraceae bacterium]MCI6343388.1 hypothetical protein [Campylobacter sp.]MCI6695555.1 hypothetical protein [Campylobacter sp.]MCI7362446.1 hypothetical protein [Campylobacter sp.]MCI7463413.1 hypothetical protein [Campylobacter sp.]